MRAPEPLAFRSLAAVACEQPLLATPARIRNGQTQLPLIKSQPERVIACVLANRYIAAMAETQEAPFTQLLTDQHTVIFGGSSGIGKATAKAHLSCAGRATLVSRSEAKLAAAAQDLNAPDRVSTASVDMMDEGAVKAFFGAQANESIDHLVITASSAVHGRFAELETEPVRGMFDSKFWGPYVVAREALPKLRDAGSITFFSGVLSRRPGLNCSGLGAVNCAVEGLTYALALELGPRLRVNCCSPGMVRTEATAACRTTSVKPCTARRASHCP